MTWLDRMQNANQSSWDGDVSQNFLSKADHELVMVEEQF